MGGMCSPSGSLSRGITGITRASGLPLDTHEASDEDDEDASSTGSVLRLPVCDDDGSEVGSDDGSEGSVIRTMPEDGAASLEEQDSASVRACAGYADEDDDATCSPWRPSRSSDGNLSRQSSVRFAPAPEEDQALSKRSNLQAAAKYFMRGDGGAAVCTPRGAGVGPRIGVTGAGFRSNGIKPAGGTNDQQNCPEVSHRDRSFPFKREGAGRGGRHYVIILSLLLLSFMPEVLSDFMGTSRHGHLIQHTIQHNMKHTCLDAVPCTR